MKLSFFFADDMTETLSTTILPSNTSSPLVIPSLDNQIFEGDRVFLVSIESTDPSISVNENNTFTLTVLEDEGRLYGPPVFLYSVTVFCMPNDQHF